MINKETLYKAPEPSEGINFKSKDSQKLLSRCIQNNTANPFFELSDQFTTQTYGSYCGPTNISIILNSMGIDPGETIFRHWKYYNEKNIHGCDLESVHNHGMPITEVAFLFQYNSVKARLYRPFCDNNNCYPLYLDINKLSDNKNYNKLLLIDDISTYNYSTIYKGVFEKEKEKGNLLIYFNLVNEIFFRICILASTFYNNFYILCNIHRTQLGQEGGGHYLPVLAYNMENDLVLIFDCARFKYNSRWHKLNVLFNAQNGKDRVTNNTRGFIIAEKPNIKKINLITNDMVKIIDEKYISTFISKLKFDSIVDKAYVLNWLIINNFEYNFEINEYKHLWDKTIPKLYNEGKKFKEFVDFIFMFDRKNLKILLIGTLLFLNSK